MVRAGLPDMTRLAAPLRDGTSYLSNLRIVQIEILDNCVLLTVHSLSVVCNKGLAVAILPIRLFAGSLVPRRARTPEPQGIARYRRKARCARP
jgi:hypothetical protein